MRKIKYLFLVLLLFNGCKNEQNPITPIEKPLIIPLKIGNQWLGEAERIGNDGSVITSSNVGIFVIGSSMVDSTNLFILQRDEQQYYCLNTDSGFVYNWNNQNYWQYKYPATVGEQFTISSNAYRVVVSTDTIITTEYGKYNCYHYSLRFYDNDFHTEEFISPNTGFVYVEHYQTDGPTPEIFLYSRITYNPILISSD
jgi:hypothetical protein